MFHFGSLYSSCGSDFNVARRLIGIFTVWTFIVRLQKKFTFVTATMRCFFIITIFFCGNITIRTLINKMKMPNTNYYNYIVL